MQSPSVLRWKEVHKGWFLSVRMTARTHGRPEVLVPESDVDTYVASEATRLGLPPSEHKANLAAEKKLDRVRHGARIAATVDEMIRRAGGEVE